MVLYARSDVVSVSVPAAEGGCGQIHTRPVVAGKPSKSFALSCSCEDFLRRDIARDGMRKQRSGEDHRERYAGLWGATPDTIPQTHDEEKKADAENAELAKTAATSNADALATIAQAMAGNAELMTKILALAVSDKTVVAAIEKAEVPPVVLVHDGFNSRECDGCHTPIIRAEGQRGALPHRCPDCKAAKQAAYRNR